jgi:hypothetical protein
MRRRISANASSRRRRCSRHTVLSSPRDNSSACILSLSHTKRGRFSHWKLSGHPSAPIFKAVGSYSIVPPHPGTVQGFDG